MVPELHYQGNGKSRERIRKDEEHSVHVTTINSYRAFHFTVLLLLLLSWSGFVGKLAMETYNSHSIEIARFRLDPNAIPKNAVI